jgi:hypothetical protein
LLHLLDEARDVPARGKRDDAQAFGLGGHDRERALTDGAGRAEDRDVLHQNCRYRTKT